MFPPVSNFHVWFCVINVSWKTSFHQAYSSFLTNKGILVSRSQLSGFGCMIFSKLEYGLLQKKAEIRNLTIVIIRWACVLDKTMLSVRKGIPKKNQNLSFFPRLIKYSFDVHFTLRKAHCISAWVRLQEFYSDTTRNVSNRYGSKATVNLVSLYYKKVGQQSKNRKCFDFTTTYVYDVLCREWSSSKTLEDLRGFITS